MQKPIIAPSVLSADFTDLRTSFQLFQNEHSDWVHVDIMDGRFVPNLSYGLPVVTAMRTLTDKFFDVHLMIVEPEKYLEEFKKAGADQITVHLEACIHLHRTIQQIHLLGMKAGVALNPHTPIALLEDILPELDIVCIMSVNPGFGGQKFIPNSIKKIKQLKELRQLTNSHALIEVDGGIGISNAKEVVLAGADVLVAGSSIFKANNPVEAAYQLKHILL